MNNPNGLPEPYYSESGITIYHGDCREILPSIGKVDLVLTDPPYGISVGINGHVGGGTASAKWKGAVRVDYGVQQWDGRICQGEIDAAVLLARFSIVFGGNYYTLPSASRWLVWDKETNGNFADCELAWTNIPGAVRRIRYLWNGFARQNAEPRGDHPTQKPIGVMKWAISQAPEDCALILDPFMGSGTTLVAAKQLGRRAIGIEISREYCDIAVDRLRQDVLPLAAMPEAQPVTGELF